MGGVGPVRDVGVIMAGGEAEQSSQRVGGSGSREWCGCKVDPG